MECLVVSDNDGKEQDLAMDLSRRKKRKTRGERNKLRDKSKTKEKPEKQSELRKQITLAQNMMASRPEKIQGERSACVITQNRLTKRLGLFNQGKKSSSVVRDNIHLPSKLKQVVEDDLRKILGKPRSSECEMPSSDVREMARSNKTPASARSAYSLNRSTGLSPATLMSLDEDEDYDEENLQPVQSIPGSPDYIEIMERLTIKVKPSRYFPAKDYLQKTTTELCKLIRQNCPPLVCDTETPMKSTPHSHVSSDVVCRDLSPSLPPTPKKGSAERQSSKQKEKSHLGQHESQLYFNEGSVLASLFPDTENLSVRDSSRNSHNLRHSRTNQLDPTHAIGASTSNQFQHLLDAAHKASNHNYDYSQQAPSYSNRRADISYAISSANQTDSFNMRQSSSLADPYHMTVDVNENEQQLSALSLFADEPLSQSEAVVTQALYPAADSNDLLYRRNAQTEHRGVDLLDDMDMEFQSYCESCEWHGSHDRSHDRPHDRHARSHDEHFDPRDPSLWLNERPPPFLRSPTPPKQLYPRRLY